MASTNHVDLTAIVTALGGRRATGVLGVGLARSATMSRAGLYQRMSAPSSTMLLPHSAIRSGLKIYRLSAARM